MTAMPLVICLSELSNFVLNHLQLKVPMDVGFSDIPRRINISPEENMISFYDGVTFSNICLKIESSLNEYILNGLS